MLGVGHLPLQPGHTQIPLIAASKALGERVVFNFQLGNLSRDSTM